MGVNPKGIWEGVAGRPGGRAQLPEAGSCQGRKRLWNSRLWEKGWPCGRVFSAGPLQANSALIPCSLLCREMGAGKGSPAPFPAARLPFSWRTGQEVGRWLGRM